MAERDFDSPGELIDWLSAAGIDTSRWGQGASKGAAALWDEYAGGETAFQDDPPLRLVDVAQVILRRGATILTELEQELADGRRRARRRPPSEKLKRGEMAGDAARRCLVEELAMAEEEITLRAAGEPVEMVADSPSYPGLPTRYRLYTFEGTVAGLPQEDFAIKNGAPDDPVRRHYWGWRPPDS